MPEYYLVHEENANVNVEGAEKQDDDNKRVHMGCFTWFRPAASRHPQVRGPFFMTSGTCDSSLSALRQARLGRSLHCGRE